MAEPTIRFRGFDDEWEQRKLGDVAQEFKSGNSLKADEIDITGDYPVYGGNGLRGYTSTYNHDGEYALIGRQGALCGNMNYSAGKAYFTEHAVVVKADENNDTRFLYYMLDTMNLGQYSDQSAQPGLAVNKLVKLENSFPKKEEQQQIGAYFRSLDHLITLHQRKCDETKKLKKYMLQKMFPQNGSKVPEIRFKGFTDEWEQRKLGELSEKTFGGGTPKTSNESFWKGNIPWIQSSDLIEGSLFDVEPRKYISQEAVDKSATKLVPENSVAIVTRVGVGKLAFMPFSYATSQDFLSLSVLKTEPKFTVYALYKKLQSELNAVQGTSIKGVTKDELLAKKVMIPCYKEQEKIGSYLHSLDHLITLHQHKCEELKKLKKFMLQNMFTQKNK